jgi:DNA polymerase-3 subunit gamma/tau
VSCSNGALAVAVSEPGNVRAIAQRGHDERLRQAIIDVLALDLSIDVLHDPEPAAPGQGPNPDSGSPAGTSGPQRSTRDSNSGSAQAAAPAPAARPADVVRDADRVGPGAEPADDASPDDPDLDTDAAHGLALITRELGAKPIGEIDHS